MATKKETPIKAEIVVKQTTTIAEEVLSLEITNKVTMVGATELLSKINKQGDLIKAEKEKITKPLNQALKVEQKRWKPAEDAIKKAVAHIRSEMSRYQTQQDEIAESEKNKIAARTGSGKGKFKIETAIAKMSEIDTPDTKVETESGSVSFRDDYEITVVDKRLIPEIFLEVDITAVKNAIKAGITVDGVTFKKIKVPVNRR
jgi:primosomal protein N'